MSPVQRPSIARLGRLADGSRRARAAASLRADRPAFSCLRLCVPVYVNFSAGAIAGVTELCLLFPLDTVKTRQQLSKGKQVGMVTMFKEIVAAEGCVLLACAPLENRRQACARQSSHSPRAVWRLGPRRGCCGAKVGLAEHAFLTHPRLSESAGCTAASSPL